ncbi:beta-hydroxyacid dehydrogenase, 3-hydroxyisobutyrate dehydrogenase [Polaromonas sp. CF318]|uniref:NAD(P)-dependent oxidoreductase n=1 Tax=Polaromonas sp. CF318 TaxID=1144318 RepID=UPI000270F1DE|nr:NAD(P)-dependent oxidoreductase [Polaromonas sp. CF318]EJL89006.1 beta-hydroxyacid dehydrogenase, 3-hydroxyisobutyrate dehydrogenase [Polaromonas sp. CF318]
MHTYSLSSMSVGLIGYGEVGKIFAAALQAGGAKAVSTWDRLFSEGQRGTEAGIQRCASLADLLQHCELVFSAVTASQTLAVAREAAGLLRPGTVFVDLNSASPKTKRDGAAAIEAAGGRYLEAAVMTSVPPYGLRVPMLLGGPHAREMAPVLCAWGLDAKAASSELGTASAIKMCRSVVIKGLEAIVVESFTAARAYGVEDEVLASLKETMPGLNWEQQGSYFFERVIRHGQRRSQEMAESAATMADVGIGGSMAAAASQRQGWTAALARQGVFGASADSWRSRADEILAAVGSSNPQR